MIFKIVAFLVALFVVYLLFFRSRNPNIGSRSEEKVEKKKKRKSKDIEEVMVDCEACDTFISTKDAIIKDGKFYCSKECASLK